jgi:hypothetical protein
MVNLWNCEQIEPFLCDMLKTGIMIHMNTELYWCDLYIQGVSKWLEQFGSWFFFLVSVSKSKCWDGFQVDTVPGVASLLSWHPFYAWLWDMRFPRRATPGSTFPGCKPCCIPTRHAVVWTGFPSPLSPLPLCRDLSRNFAMRWHSAESVGSANILEIPFGLGA